MKSSAVALLLLLSSPCTASSVNAPQISKIETKFQAFDSAITSALNKTDPVKSREIERSYKSLFGNEQGRPTAAWSSSDLKLGFRAASQVAFYSLDDRYLEDMARYLTLLEANKQASTAEYGAMYGALVQARRLDLAKTMYLEHGNAEMEPLPHQDERPSSENKAREWSVDSEGSLTLHSHQPKAAEIIIVSHPSCGFTRRAVQDLDAAFGKSSPFFLSTHWLTPQDRRFQVDSLRKWNGQHSNARMFIVYKQREWSQFDSWDTPTFYFLKNGKLKQKIVGWPNKEQVGKIMKAARKIGLTDKIYKISH
ncbi:MULTISPECIES: hypothetical protein [Lysobacter]|uniref:hypothetical protein n=1 Tax=Lysobacter TaxID=68 RepID=UPI001F25DF24|nr:MULTISPECIES: hypothetical protein [Lysobacter]UJB17266.1 hypothetical protein L1A79_12775 [Lysobacter capsici]UJQ29011.1 hypothetical protein L2D09_02090 [Lysobacter gummosus]